MAGEESKPEQDESGRFVSGNIGGGRGKGSRNKLNELFFVDLYAKWQEKGATAIDAMIDQRPGDFVKCVAATMPKEFSLNGNVLGDLTDAELGDFLAALRSFKDRCHSAENGGGAEEAVRH